MNILKKGFTLAELLISLAVLGILVAILVPVIMSIMPDQNALMAKRAYYTIQTIISDMINDDACYPDKTRSINPTIGFDDGYGYVNCEKWGGDDETAQYITESDPNLKFIKLFISRLDTKGKVEDWDLESHADIRVKTKDGMTWIFPTGEFAFDSDSYATIAVDVSGDEGLNCSQDSTTGTWDRCDDKPSGHDIFAINIFPDGTLVIVDSWAIKAVDINKDVTSDDEDDAGETSSSANDNNNNGNEEFGDKVPFPSGHGGAQPIGFP